MSRGRWIAAALALALDGCGAGSPPAPRPAVPAAVARAERTHEYRTAPPPVQRPVTSDPSPATAIRRFATRYINWDAGTVGPQLRALAAASLDQARSAMQLAAAQAGSDPELQRGGVANHGVVEAVAPLSGGRWVVVTREWTTAAFTTAYQGLRPAWHVSVARAARARGGWAVSSWQPES